MRFDENGILVSEMWTDTQNGWAANRGDSMANTARFTHLKLLSGEPIPAIDPVLSLFRTATGYLRYPSFKMPKDWMEQDSTSDQCLPWYLIADLDLRREMFNRIAQAGWKTGNGDYVNPLFFAVLHNLPWAIDQCLLAQMALFAVPFRWSDEKKWFELSRNASADYLNWFHVLLAHGSPWVKRLVNKEKLKTKIQNYYDIEPNSKWLVDLYNQVINEVL